MTLMYLEVIFICYCTMLRNFTGVCFCDYLEGIISVHHDIFICISILILSGTPLPPTFFCSAPPLFFVVGGGGAYYILGKGSIIWAHYNTCTIFDSLSNTVAQFYAPLGTSGGILKLIIGLSISPSIHYKLCLSNNSKTTEANL